MARAVVVVTNRERRDEACGGRGVRRAVMGAIACLGCGVAGEGEVGITAAGAAIDRYYGEPTGALRL